MMLYLEYFIDMDLGDARAPGSMGDRRLPDIHFSPSALTYQHSVTTRLFSQMKPYTRV